MPLSSYEKAKRAFVSLLVLLSRSYHVILPVTRKSSDAQLLSAFKRLVRATHPDKGGKNEDQQRLNAAKDRFEEARAERRCGAGRPGGAADDPAPPQPVLPISGSGRHEFHIHAPAVLLTYQGIKDLAQWKRFVNFASTRLKSWKVKCWSATLEANAEEGSPPHESSCR